MDHVEFPVAHLVMQPDATRCRTSSSVTYKGKYLLASTVGGVAMKSHLRTLPSSRYGRYGKSWRHGGLTQVEAVRKPEAGWRDCSVCLSALGR